VGVKLPRENLKVLVSADQEKNKTVVIEFLQELHVILTNRNYFNNMINLNDIYDEICTAVKMKDEVNNFKRDVLSTTHELLTIGEINRLIEAAESICFRHSNSCNMVKSKVNQFASDIKVGQSHYLR
jgi:hypothetical protein